jgi:hypothetical protein
MFLAGRDRNGTRLDWMVLLDRIELSTSPLPRECSTTELQQQDQVRRLADGEAERRAKAATHLMDRAGHCNRAAIAAE